MSQLKTSLDHLPGRYRRELDLALKILFEELERATANKTSDKKRNGKILKIILFGSFARGDWTDDVVTGYRSDYDLLIVVNSQYMVEFGDYWYDAEDRLIREHMQGNIKGEVNFIVHSIDDVNQKLAEGQYFFTDIKEQGIALYEAQGSTKLANAKPLTPERHYEISKEYFEGWYPKIETAIKGARFYIQEGDDNDAAFLLHQAVERAYSCVLLTFTHYGPATHNIRDLRSWSEDHDKRLIPAWPRENDVDRVRKLRANFELLKKAYVEARYSKHFAITDEQLNWLTERAEVLNDLVKVVCEDHLAALKGKLSD